MRRELLMRAESSETTVAVVEDGRLVELYLERESDSRVVGNIYKGVVKNILPGMQAAFVDIGLDKNAFLYVDDAWIEASGLEKDSSRTPIQSLLKEGQELMVQITKEPVGTKGARITAQITLPGRYLVLMPTVDHSAVSRRIQKTAERQRLQALAEELKPESIGLIVRTIGEGASREELLQDQEQLMLTWDGIRNRFAQGSVKGLIYKDLGLCQRILRDVFSTEINRLMVNSRALYNEVQEYLDFMEPRLKRKVFVCNMEELFDKYSIPQETSAALDRKVWLKNGSYLIFDRTEALTVIDVNTGKYVGSTDLTDTILRTNMEAAREIARQLRIRNIGGIIIIDFIDMESENHKQRVLDVLSAELNKDRVKTHILGFTPLGLVEITRKKVRQPLDSSWEAVCPYCEGKGRISLKDEKEMTAV
ncbi:MAG: Rne/Rng family ribonuclease [Peptococcaceae bacterium]|jgi:ribonuclease G|nr:Rne/Rng family ribonuclease [Peptococcaceae bacterium]